jgi:hypothetical protein
MKPAVNLEGDYGKSNQRAPAASRRAQAGTVARGEVGSGNFGDRVATWFRIISPNKPTKANYIGGFAEENGASAEGEMGEGG